MEAEVEAMLDFAGRTGLHVIQMKNLCIDPALYLDTLPDFEDMGEAMGMVRDAGHLPPGTARGGHPLFQPPQGGMALRPQSL